MNIFEYIENDKNLVTDKTVDYGNSSFQKNH